VALLFGAFLLYGCAAEHRFVKKVSFKGTHSMVITFAGSVDEVWAKEIANYAVYEKPDPDILLTITNVMLSPDMRRVTLTFDSELNQLQPHIVTVKEIMSEGRSQGTGVMTAKKIYFGYLLSILIGAMIIKNFVFTKYLGLCVFFGTSQKKSTAIGMGITFTIVAVQAVDTILRKLNPVLFNAFGVYLVLVIANCIILAVPLTLASNEYNAWESLMLAMGAGLGFLIALFLMASVREKLELASIYCGGIVRLGLYGLFRDGYFLV
jgi:electron transport complex protein RnfA